MTIDGCPSCFPRVYDVLSCTVRERGTKRIPYRHLIRVSAAKSDAMDLSPYVSCVQNVSLVHTRRPVHARVADRLGQIGIDIRLNHPRGTARASTRNIHSIPQRRERTATDDDNDNDITIACVLRWFRSYTEDQGTHTHVCRPGRQVEEGGRDREEEVECGFGGRGAHALVHRPRTQSRYPRHTHMYVLSLPFSLIRAHNVLYYNHAIARAESGERRRARLRTCMCRLESGVRARTLRHAVFLARECSRLPRYIAPRDVRTCVSTCERAVCLHARRQRHAVPHTQLTRRLGGPGHVSSRARAAASRFTYIRYDTSEPQGRQVAHKTKETQERRYGESKTVTVRDRGRAIEAKNRPRKKGTERKTGRGKRAGANQRWWRGSKRRERRDERIDSLQSWRGVRCCFCYSWYCCRCRCRCCLTADTRALTQSRELISLSLSTLPSFRSKWRIVRGWYVHSLMYVCMYVFRTTDEIWSQVIKDNDGTNSATPLIIYIISINF